ncbi:MAG: hypothetical protein SGBAC_007808 [Bacillariaceae sp.]
MMRQYFQNLVAETGASEITLVGDKASLPCFGPRRTSLSISFASSCESRTSTRKFDEISEDDCAPSFPMRKLSSGSLTSIGSSDEEDEEDELSNSRWVSTPPRSKSSSPIPSTRKTHRRKASAELSLDIKSVILRDLINVTTNAATEDKILLSPPKRKDSIEEALFCLYDASGLRRTRSAELAAHAPFKCQSRWNAIS